MSKCAIIVSGGTLDEALTFETLREYEEPCVIGVDRGVEFLYRHKIRPNYIVGDFDSLPEIMQALLPALLQLLFFSFFFPPIWLFCSISPSLN